MKLPSNLSVKDINLNSSDVDIYYDTVYYDSSAQHRKIFNMKDMKEKFYEYKRKQTLNDDDDTNKFGNIEVLFNNHKYNEFKEKIQEFTTD